MCGVFLFVFFVVVVFFAGNRVWPLLESVSQRDSIQDGDYSFSARSYQSWGFGDVS